MKGDIMDLFVKIFFIVLICSFIMGLIVTFFEIKDRKDRKDTIDNKNKKDTKEKKFLYSDGKNL